MKIKALGIGLFIIFSLPLGAQEENASAQISPLSPRENGPPSLPPPVIASPYFLPQPPQSPPPLLLPPSRFDSEEPLRRPIHVPLPESSYRNLGMSAARYLQYEAEKREFKKISQEDSNRLLFRNIFDGPPEFTGYGKTMAEIIQSDSTRTGDKVALGKFSGYPGIQIKDPIFGSKVEIVRFSDSAETREEAAKRCMNFPPEGSWKLPTEEFIMGVLNKYEIAFWDQLLPNIHFSPHYAEVNGTSLKLKNSTKLLDGTPLWVQPEEDGFNLILISQVYPFTAKGFSMTELIEAGTAVNTDRVVKEEKYRSREAFAAQIMAGIPVVCAKVEK